MLLIFGGISLGRRCQKSIALDARLDVCGVRVASERQRLYAALVKSNHLLLALQSALYALRGAKLVPIVGVFSGASEAELLATARAIVTMQEAQIQLAIPKELASHGCLASPFSRLPAICAYGTLAWQNFRRERSLFPVIPGPLRLATRDPELLKISCGAFLFRSRHARSIALQGNPSLLDPGFSYAYE